MEAKNDVTAHVLFGVAALFLLVGQFVDWFRLSVGFFGRPFHAGFDAWGTSSSDGGRSWLSMMGEEGTSGQATLMMLAGPLLVAGTALAVVGFVALVRARRTKAAWAGICAGACGTLAGLFGFLANYTSPNERMAVHVSGEMHLGMLLILAGTVAAFGAGTMARAPTPASTPADATPAQRRT